MALGSQAMDVHLVRRKVGARHVLEVSGDLDLSTVPRLHGDVTSLIADAIGELGDRANGPHVVAVDVDGVLSLDDSALGVLLGAAGRIREAGGDLVIVCSDPRLRRRFELTGLDRAIRIVTSLSDAAR